MSLLSVVRRANALVGLRRPSVAAQAPDATSTAQMAEMARIEAESLANAHDWSGIVLSHQFTTVGNQRQPGALPDDFARFTFGGGVYGPQGRITGPVDKADWSRITVPAWGRGAGLYGSFRVFAGGMEIFPQPAAGQTYRYDYVTRLIYADAAGTPKDTWDADTDTCAIPENLIALGIVWRWLQAKGLDYGEAMRNFEIEFGKLAGNDGAGRGPIAIGRSRFAGSVGVAYPYALGPDQ